MRESSYNCVMVNCSRLVKCSRINCTKMDSGVSNLTCYYSHFLFEVAHTFSTWCSWQLISWTGIYSNYKCNFNYKFYSWLNLLTSKIWTNFVQQQTRMPHEQNRNIGDWTYESRNAEALKQFMKQCQKWKFHLKKKKTLKKQNNWTWFIFEQPE